MEYPAYLIAYAFVKRGIDEDMPVNQMKLQKMVYFAHGYHLAKYGRPLILEIFEAWDFGPVVESIYSTYRAYGISPITEVSRKIKKKIKELSESAKDAINYTWEVTRGLSAYALSNWTHKPNSPWSDVYVPNSLGITIANSRIKKYFSDLLSKHANK